MNHKLKKFKMWIRDGGHKKFRQTDIPDLIRECDQENLSWTQRSAGLTVRMCEAEQALIFPEEKIVFTRTVPGIPAVYSEQDLRKQFSGKTAHELGPISNISADWGFILSQGLMKRRSIAEKSKIVFKDDPKALEFLEASIETINAVLTLVKRYEHEAEKQGRIDIVSVLRRVPVEAAQRFQEALQSLRILHSVVWMSGHYHVGLGRFDQYMFPYLKADLDSGRLDKDKAEDLLGEFFIACNKDTDLYPGIQQGDNGQSLMLGGVKPDGSNAVNKLTYMVLRVAKDLTLIDPKINLRFTPDTDIELLTLAAELTRLGTGFPQYSNDEIVIPALIRHGYKVEDARNYAVAACWEFIILGKGLEIVNTGAVSLPAAVDRGIRDSANGNLHYEVVLQNVKKNIQRQLDGFIDRYQRLILPPAPYYSLLFEGCLENGTDLSQGLYYNNFGVHGAASASAADALSAVRHLIEEETQFDLNALILSLDADFENSEQLRDRLLITAPKIGNNDDAADRCLIELMDLFAEACESYQLKNGVEQRIRPGTGSAMYYLWLSRGHDNMLEPLVGSTADGHKRGDFFSANLAPSPNVQVRGPISVIKSFSKIDYQRIYNGAPITIELSDSVFSDGEDIDKVAMLIRTFVQQGGTTIAIKHFES